MRAIQHGTWGTSVTRAMHERTPTERIVRPWTILSCQRLMPYPAKGSAVFRSPGSLGRGLSETHGARRSPPTEPLQGRLAGGPGGQRSSDKRGGRGAIDTRREGILDCRAWGPLRPVSAIHSMASFIRRTAMTQTPCLPQQKGIRSSLEDLQNLSSAVGDSRQNRLCERGSALCDVGHYWQTSILFTPLLTRSGGAQL
jgi:hypothetical protein